MAIYKTAELLLRKIVICTIYRTNGNLKILVESGEEKNGKVFRGAGVGLDLGL